MTRDDVIQWAREAARQPERVYAPDEVEFLEALASLVASATRRRYQAEVERWQAESVTAEKWRGIALTKAEIYREAAEALRQEGAAVEREACARINDAKAERLAQEAEDAARERDAETVTANRAAALLLIVCAAAIRVRKDSA